MFEKPGLSCCLSVYIINKQIQQDLSLYKGLPFPYIRARPLYTRVDTTPGAEAWTGGDQGARLLCPRRLGEAAIRRTRAQGSLVS